MTYLIVAYLLIAVILSGYGISLWRRMQATWAEIRRLGSTLGEEPLHIRGGGR